MHDLIDAGDSYKLPNGKQVKLLRAKNSVAVRFVPGVTPDKGLNELKARKDARFKAAFDALRDLMTPAEPKRRPIGFVYPKEK